MNKQERNEYVKQYVDSKLSEAKKLTENNFQSSKFSKEGKIHQLASSLIEVRPKGFRGVVLTAIVGLKIDPNFDPLNKFYDCNPRTIFEKGIYFSLTENEIPCGKSDPLNVAKNIDSLDSSWVKGKRPESSAKAAIEYIKEILEAKNEEDRESLINYFFFRLIKYAKSIQNYKVKINSSVEITKTSISLSLANFIIHFPEGGSTPQFLIWKIIEEIYSSSSIEVHGGGESVFGTNTTSKKPADIWLSENGEITNLYEITVKIIDIKRIEDCFQSLYDLGEIDKPVTFICRIPEDVKELELDELSLNYKDKIFNFIDIRDFILITSTILSKNQFNSIVEAMREFISDVNISIRTKEGWNKYLG